MLSNDQKEQLIELLKAPIVRNREIKIRKDSGEIESTQQYPSNFDPDMSDFAVGYYKVIYRNILASSILESAEFENKMFAGDTMNSFNRVANRIATAGRSASKRTPQNEWPEYLRDYYEKYHCLANFWILPSELGRSRNHQSLNKNQGSWDYMDRYLKRVQAAYSGEYQEDFEKYRDYFEKFDGFEDFCDKHFLRGVYVDNNYGIMEYSEQDSPEKVIEDILMRINQRAEVIARSQYAKKLWDYFGKCSVVNTATA
ncbi:hypothetical protein [Arcanobacterium phocae]|uniref:hypothetical protein n=1 Tax=Arcanobacterium phocae TaxID=131112 RepID=UPI001C0EE94D|nr:hypothetical protein [Arcanobacterium phocae]